MLLAIQPQLCFAVRGKGSEGEMALAEGVVYLQGGDTVGGCYVSPLFHSGLLYQRLGRYVQAHDRLWVRNHVAEVVHECEVRLREQQGFFHIGEELRHKALTFPEAVDDEVNPVFLRNRTAAHSTWFVLSVF